MKIKSLLIGSAAAIVAAPAAFAADVIIAEPEPVEYVEVCDVAGAGYFYIPGSRTCIQFSGLVRHELRFDDNEFDDGVTELDLSGGGVTDLIIGNGSKDGIDSLVRAELKVRTFTETELGDLTSYFRFRADDVNDSPTALIASSDETVTPVAIDGVVNNGNAFLTDATIGLGGLLMGRSDTLFDGGINGEFDDFGGGSVHFIRYTADLGAFSASLSLEAERALASRFDYIPNVVGKLSGDLGAFSVDLFAAYDDADTADSVLTPPQDLGITGFRFNDDEFALKARVGADLGAFALQAAATYNSGANYYSNGYEYSFGASAKVGIGEKAALTFGAQYFANAQVSVADAALLTAIGGGVVNGEVGRTSVTVNDSDKWTAGVDLDYKIVDGFDMKVSVNYVDIDLPVNDPDGNFSGFIRFDRSF